MEQSTIIETTLPIRRRSLLHIALKIYICVGMVIPFFSFLYLLAMIKSALFFNDVFYVGLGIVSAVLTGFLVSIPASLWFEWKWAIRYNWITAGQLLLVMIAVCFIEDWQIEGSVATLVAVPYWIMLSLIQRRWETVTKL